MNEVPIDLFVQTLHSLDTAKPSGYYLNLATLYDENKNGQIDFNEFERIKTVASREGSSFDCSTVTDMSQCTPSYGCVADPARADVCIEMSEDQKIAMRWIASLDLAHSKGLDQNS